MGYWKGEKLSSKKKSEYSMEIHKYFDKKIPNSLESILNTNLNESKWIPKPALQSI